MPPLRYSDSPLVVASETVRLEQCLHKFGPNQIDRTIKSHGSSDNDKTRDATGTLPFYTRLSTIVQKESWPECDKKKNNALFSMARLLSCLAWPGRQQGHRWLHAP